MRIPRGKAAFARPVILAVILIAAACSGDGGSQKGHVKAGGTASLAWVGASPDFIFPLPPATNTNGYNANLENPLWPNLTYDGDGSQAAVNPQESLFSAIRYTDRDTTITITLKPWKWSDGAPVTSRDFTFVYHLLKAEVPNWYLYVPGLFPDDVASVATPRPHTVVMHLTHSYNPTFYTENVLSEVPLLPQHAWDKTSMSGKAGNDDDTTAGAKAVYAFLAREGAQMTTFTTNPLWKVVDGPWTLASFQSNGAWDFVPNQHYSGPDKPILARWNNVPYTTDAAELDALRSGSSADVATLPPPPPPPYSPSAAIALLKARGWEVVPGGTSTCQRPAPGPPTAAPGSPPGSRSASSSTTPPAARPWTRRTRPSNPPRPRPGSGLASRPSRSTPCPARWAPAPPPPPGLGLRLAAGEFRLRPLRGLPGR